MISGIFYTTSLVIYFVILYLIVNKHRKTEILKLPSDTQNVYDFKNINSEEAQIQRIPQYKLTKNIRINTACQVYKPGDAGLIMHFQKLFIRNYLQVRFI